MTRILNAINICMSLGTCCLLSVLSDLCGLWVCNGFLEGNNGTRMNNALRKHVRKLVILGITFPCQKAGQPLTTMEIFTIPRKIIPSLTFKFVKFLEDTKSYFIKFVKLGACQDSYMFIYMSRWLSGRNPGKTNGLKITNTPIHGDIFGTSTFCRILSMNSIVDEDMGYINIG